MIGEEVNPDFFQEVRLYENSAERERLDNMSELYAVLNALECLEKMLSRDCIPPKEYTAECSKLLVQYKVISSLYRHSAFFHYFRIQLILKILGALSNREVIADPCCVWNRVGDGGRRKRNFY